LSALCNKEKLFLSQLRSEHLFSLLSNFQLDRIDLIVYKRPFVRSIDDPKGITNDICSEFLIVLIGIQELDFLDEISCFISNDFIITIETDLLRDKEGNISIGARIFTDLLIGGIQISSLLRNPGIRGSQDSNIRNAHFDHR